MFVLVIALFTIVAEARSFSTVSNSMSCDFNKYCGFGPVIIAIRPGDDYNVDVQPKGLIEPKVTGSTLSWTGTEMLQTYEGDASVTVTMPKTALKTIDNVASNDMTIFKGFDFSGGFTVNSGGSGDTQVEETKGGKINLALSGSGDVNVFDASGSKLTVSNSGSGEIYVKATEAIPTDLDSSGSGDMTIVFPKDSGAAVTVESSGSGDIDVAGAGTVDGNSLGSGEIKIYHTGDKPAVNVKVCGSGEIDYEKDEPDTEKFDSKTTTKYKPGLNYADGAASSIAPPLMLGSLLLLAY